jgi:hypothetical protein
MGPGYFSVVLDSFMRKDAESDLSMGLMKHDLAVGSRSDIAISVDSEMTDIFMIEIYPFTIPLLAPTSILPSNSGGLTYGINTSDFTTGTDSLTNPLSQLPNGGRVTIEIVGCGNTIHNYGGKVHHLELVATMDSNNDRLLLTPIRSRFVFTTPLSSKTDIALRFRNPDCDLSLPDDTIRNVTITTVSDQVLFTGPSGVAINIMLSAGDRIYFKGVGTTLSELNRYLIRDEGHVVGEGGLTATTFRLNPDVDITNAGSVSYASTTVVNVMILKNRIRIPFHFRGVLDRHTNHLAPTTS